ncbi:hypothetical protein PIB30_052413 [Stylosanthes scabra]|uniref:Uncharacterized protein n=1 Tax=Stylosanthes scabra TaxID=79078 RepID=A0ABU6RII7_9FABA|nr:hypothetical protein [Stylosanthes scabra]
MGVSMAPSVTVPYGRGGGDSSSLGGRGEKREIDWLRFEMGAGYGGLGGGTVRESWTSRVLGMTEGVTMLPIAHVHCVACATTISTNLGGCTTSTSARGIGAMTTDEWRTSPINGSRECFRIAKSDFGLSRGPMDLGNAKKITLGKPLSEIYQTEEAVVKKITLCVIEGASEWKSQERTRLLQRSQATCNGSSRGGAEMLPLRKPNLFLEWPPWKWIDSMSDSCFHQALE